MGLGPAPPGAAFPGADGVTLDTAGAGATLEVKPLGIGAPQLAAGAVTPSKLGAVADGVTLDAGGVGGTLEILPLGVGTPQLANAGPGATGPLGTSLRTPVITIDAKGRVTALSDVATLDFFDRVAAGTAPTWSVLFPLLYSQASATGATSNGNRLKLQGAVATTTWANGHLLGPLTLNPTGSDWNAGDKAWAVAKFLVANFASLAANALAGIELSDQALTTAPILSKDTTVSPTVRRVTAGIDNAGHLWIVTCNGTTVTATDQGFVAVNATALVLSLLFTAGTSVIATVNANAPVTVTATLPTRLVIHGAGVLSGNASPALSVYGGAGRLQTL